MKEIAFAKVFTSPLQRARQTCALAGFASVAEVDGDLVEWNYGEYEGLRSPEIRAKRRASGKLSRTGDADTEKNPTLSSCAVSFTKRLYRLRAIASYEQYLSQTRGLSGLSE